MLNTVKVEVVAEGTRHNGADIQVGEIIEIDRDLLGIWTRLGIAKVSEEGNEYPKYIPVGKWQLSNGDIIPGRKEDALKAEADLKTKSQEEGNGRGEGTNGQKEVGDNNGAQTDNTSDNGTGDPGGSQGSTTD